MSDLRSVKRRRSLRRQQEDRDSRIIKQAIFIASFMLVAGLSYFAGTIHSQIIGGVKSVFGEDVTLDLSSLQETYRQVYRNFDGDIDKQKLIDGANKGMVDALGDDYTVFMNSSETDEFNKGLSGDIGGGIGVEIGLRSEQPTVVRVLRDNPAEKAGVQVGDAIIGVNGEDMIGASVNDVVSRVRGEAGTTVSLKLFRQGKEVEVSVTRDQVNNPSVYSSIDNGVGVITITRFDNDTGSLTRRSARELKDAKVKGVVLDLRGNGGGYVNAAKDVASVWLDDKIVVIEKSGGRIVEEARSGTNPILNGIPTTVLVNESSASASEIVAGALRDHGMANIVGKTTFGKGSVQRLIDLSGGATLKITTARWYTPAGLNISEKGIDPDIEVERTVEDIDAGRDPQLDRAKKGLR